MIDQFKSYFVKLERLSSAELDRSAEKLVVAENGNIAKLIAHIAEMSARKAALELGYKNLFDYCVRRLNLSEGAVPARIHVANVSRRFPQLLVAFAENRISLTVASLLAAHVCEDNVDKLISDCAGMTRKATEEYLVALRPKPVFEPSIRKRPRPAAPSPRGAGTSTRSMAEEEPANSSAGAIRRVQLPVCCRPGFQSQVRATRRGLGGRECSEAHGGDSREGRRHRAREERPEKKARAAAEAGESKISFERARPPAGAGPIKRETT